MEELSNNLATLLPEMINEMTFVTIACFGKIKLLNPISLFKRCTMEKISHSIEVQSSHLCVSISTSDLFFRVL